VNAVRSRLRANARSLLRDKFKSEGRSQRVATTPGALPPMLAEEFADVQAFVRFTLPGSSGRLA
jgi:hypothetical protein